MRLPVPVPETPGCDATKLIVIGTRTYVGREWTHVDADERPLWDAETKTRKPVDVVCDARRIKLPNCCARFVYSNECLEHFPHKQYANVLHEWARLVAPGGRIRIEVPDFLAACQQVLDGDSLEMDRAIQQIVFAEQLNEFDFHYVGLTPRMLTDDFEQIGFEVVDVKRGWEHGWLMMEARRP